MIDLFVFGPHTYTYSGPHTGAPTQGGAHTHHGGAHTHGEGDEDHTHCTDWAKYSCSRSFFSICSQYNEAMSLIFLPQRDLT